MFFTNYFWDLFPVATYIFQAHLCSRFICTVHDVYLFSGLA